MLLYLYETPMSDCSCESLLSAALIEKHQFYIRFRYISPFLSIAYTTAVTVWLSSSFGSDRAEGGTGLDLALRKGHDRLA